MKILSKPIIGIAILTLFFFVSCKNNNVKDTNKNADSKTGNVNETEVLLNFFEQTGNLINAPEMPAMVSIDEVYEHLDDYLVIDIRKHEDYVAGHIDGAVNVQKPDLYAYMSDSVSAANYKKIVFTCYINHSASYAAMMFRLAGYGNVYSLRYGMSSCDKTIAEKKWWAGISNKYSSSLETKENPKNQKADYPVLKTGESTPYKILQSRIKELLSDFKFTIDADDVFQSPEKYYIINYWPADHYSKGHIPGAVQYTPKSSLIRSAELSTLPTDKPIVVYDYTGQHAAFVTAYLQILGYDAYTLHYGANGFMHDKLISLGIGNAYNKAEHFKPYPLVKGEKPSLKKDVAAPVNNAENENNANPVVPIIKKKDKNKQGGGC